MGLRHLSVAVVPSAEVLAPAAMVACFSRAPSQDALALVKQRRCGRVLCLLVEGLRVLDGRWVGWERVWARLAMLLASMLAFRLAVATLAAPGVGALEQVSKLQEALELMGVGLVRPLVEAEGCFEPIGSAELVVTAVRSQEELASAELTRCSQSLQRLG